MSHASVWARGGSGSLSKPSALPWGAVLVGGVLASVMSPLRAARAQERAEPPRSIAAPTGLEGELALVSGALFPHGGSWVGESLPEQIEMVVPLGVEAGLRWGRLVSLTGDGSVGPGLRDAHSVYCGDWGATQPSCSVTRYTLGGFLSVRPFRARYRLDPVLGVGIGHEWVTLARHIVRVSLDPNRPSDTVRIHQTRSGWDFVRIRLGVDVALSRIVQIGAYALLEHGEYTRMDTDYRRYHSFGTFAGPPDPRLVVSDSISPRPHLWYGTVLSFRLVLGTSAAGRAREW